MNEEGNKRKMPSDRRLDLPTLLLSSHNPLISDLGYLVTRDFFNSFLNCISMHRVFPSEQQKIEIARLAWFNLVIS